jgi:hypothetical protein
MPIPPRNQWDGWGLHPLVSRPSGGAYGAPGWNRTNIASLRVKHPTVERQGHEYSARSLLPPQAVSVLVLPAGRSGCWGSDDGLLDWGEYRESNPNSLLHRELS